ncbi:MAG TPA: putative PEP-binding protein [Acetobacteraceae bacterium]|nr:putative PEP-binding protein [Acetobacteraceae bacterium]
MARGSAPLGEVVELVAAEMVSEVCSIYVVRPGDLLELAATHGLRAAAVGHTRLRVGEGIVGLVAATGTALNLPDAQNHPAFAYRGETGEDLYASLLAVPMRRAGETLGVLAVQNRAPRRFTGIEVEVMETVAMLLAETLAASGGIAAPEEGAAGALTRRFDAAVLAGGLTMGPVVRRGSAPASRRLLTDDPAGELQRLAAATATMQRGIDELIADRLPAVAAEAAASREVLEAYRLVAADAGWLKRVTVAIRTGLTAEAAVLRVAGELRESMRRITDPYLRERLADVEDLVGRLLTALEGKAPPPPVAPGSILLARRLGPAELLDWHARGIAGVVIEEASPAGHAAILARALGLPALSGTRGVVESAADGDDAVLDGEAGHLILRPETDVSEAYAKAMAARTARQAALAPLRTAPATSADGTRIQLMLNVGLAIELDQMEATGADGIGLYRTEIGVLAKGAIADIAEQAASYARVLDAVGARPVLFRTLDLGGDKLLPGDRAEPGENPAMGWRSLRIGLDRPAVLRRQLRALLMAADGRPLSVMFPMVATVAEFRAARGLLEAEAAKAARPPERLAIGTMLEIPALLWQLPSLLAEADFVSVGSNDLMQFLFAADRGSKLLAGRYDPLSPPVLDMLDSLLEHARAASVPVSVCGEIASRPLEALVLAAMGFTTLSMPAMSILPMKALLAAADLAAFRPVLAAIRRGSGAAASLREPLAAWARERQLPI